MASDHAWGWNCSCGESKSGYTTYGGAHRAFARHARRVAHPSEPVYTVKDWGGALLTERSDRDPERCADCHSRVLGGERHAPDCRSQRSQCGDHPEAPVVSKEGDGAVWGECSACGLILGAMPLGPDPNAWMQYGRDYA